MFIDPKNYPEIKRLLRFAGCEYKSNMVETKVFPEHGKELDSNWSGGTKYFYVLVDMIHNNTCPIPENGNIGQLKTPTLDSLPVNYCLIETVIFCGKKMHPRVYFHPDNFTRMIPENKLELTKEEGDFLKTYKSLKSSYRPKNEFILNSLKAKGLIDDRNRVTILGMNY